MSENKSNNNVNKAMEFLKAKKAKQSNNKGFVDKGNTFTTKGDSKNSGGVKVFHKRSTNGS